MANHKSAEKRARQTERRTAVNTARRSRVRGSIKKVEEAIKSGDKQAATGALRTAQPEIQRGATKGVLTKNGAARRVSRVGMRVRLVGMDPLNAAANGRHCRRRGSPGGGLHGA